MEGASCSGPLFGGVELPHLPGRTPLIRIVTAVRRSGSPWDCQGLQQHKFCFRAFLQPSNSQPG